MKRSLIASLATTLLPVSAQLQTDAHWSYDAPQFSQSEPFAFEISGNYLYAGGNFAKNNPSNERFILRYNLTTSKWESVGTGTSAGVGTGGQVDSLLALPNGDLIAATRNTAGLMKWDGTNWSTYAGGITGPGDSTEVDPAEATGAVRVMKRHPDGRIFIAGSFNAAGGISANFVAAYNPATSTWDNLNGGFGPNYLQSNGTNFTADGVYDLEIDARGRVYVGGDFRTNPDGTDSRFNHIAMWDDTGAWKPLGSGIGSTGSQIVNCLAVGPDDELYVGGVFSRGWRDAVSASKSFAIWDDSQVLTPVPLSEDRPIITSENGILYIHIRTVLGNQYKVQESTTLPFPPLDNEFGRFGSSNWNLQKSELGLAPTNGGKKFYRVFVF